MAFFRQLGVDGPSALAVSVPCSLVLPTLVAATRELAMRTGFTGSSSDDVGRLLRALVASITSGTVAEIGTGCGVGAAWIASGLRTGVRLVTVELDAGRALAVAELFADNEAVTVITGDWHQIAAFAPFALLFADAASAKDEDLWPLLRPAGVVVLDDFTDPADWDDDRRRTGDERRESWLRDRRYASTMLGVGRDKFSGATRAQALVATRL